MRPAGSVLVSISMIAGFVTYTVGAGPTPAEKLDAAKRQYEDDARVFARAATMYFEKVEDEARTKGDLKALDAAKKDHEQFKSLGTLTPTTRKQAFVQPLVLARQKLNVVYAVAVKEYLLAKEDGLAAATEKDRKGFVLSTAFRLGPTKHLATIKPTKVKTEKDGFELDRIIKLPDGEIPHSIALHPPRVGPAEASFLLSGKWSAFRARVGVSRFRDTARPPQSKLTYEVLGDGVSLWKSQPNNTLNDFQLCEVCLDNVKQLTLKVHCPNGNEWARATWLEPLLAE
jgi:hypothetical protein